jgi:glycerol-3-phosphate dehydrogenase
MKIDANQVLLQSNLPSFPQHIHYDVLVIGGGVVGLACLRAATVQGWKCALIEAQPDLLSQASGNNSGIVCTGVDACPGSLERALIRDSISLFRPYCHDHNIPIRPCGSLVCKWAWNDKEEENDDTTTTTTTSTLHQVLKESHDAGDTHAALLSAEQVLQDMQESNLSHQLLGAVHIPGEIVVDPWLYSISLASHALENGADIFTNYRLDVKSLDFDNGAWTVRRKVHPTDTSSQDEWKLHAKVVINAAGIHCDTIQAAATQTQAPWMAQPRRGQYRIYHSHSNIRIVHPIQPIPTQQTKGIFVFSTIYNQLVVGPTSQEQSSRTDRTIDSTVAKELDEYIQRIIPALDVKNDFAGEYVGIRTGTNQRDYQLHINARMHWITVAGIRSTGLTASLGIGNYVVRQLQSILGSPSTPRLNLVKTTPMPPLQTVVQDFVTHQGYVYIQENKFRVTHPLTILGWNSLASNRQVLESCNSNIMT